MHSLLANINTTTSTTDDIGTTNLNTHIHTTSVDADVKTTNINTTMNAINKH